MPRHKRVLLERKVGLNRLFLSVEELRAAVEDFFRARGYRFGLSS